jgi:hypothetical protein
MRSSQAALFAILSLAPGTCDAYPIQGFGATSCAEFAKLYQLAPQTEDGFYYWAQGYMSGLNMSAAGNNLQMRELAGVALDQKRALRSYCADNPLKNYMDGVFDLFRKLPFTPQK